MGVTDPAVARWAPVLAEPMPRLRGFLVTVAGEIVSFMVAGTSIMSSVRTINGLAMASCRGD